MNIELKLEILKTAVQIANANHKLTTASVISIYKEISSALH